MVNADELPNRLTSGHQSVSQPEDMINITMSGNNYSSPKRFQASETQCKKSSENVPAKQQFV